jgi:hsp70-interacting protein
VRGGGIAPVDAGPEPVHANTHASMVADPRSTDTSTPTCKALESHGIRKALVESLVHPVPHGPDGEAEGDLDFEEKAVACVSLSIRLPLLILMGGPGCV